MHLVESSIRRRRHDARQVLRVGEERENARDGEGNPVFELEVRGQSARLRLPQRVYELLVETAIDMLLGWRASPCLDSRGGCRHMIFPVFHRKLRQQRGVQEKSQRMNGEGT